RPHTPPPFPTRRSSDLAAVDGNLLPFIVFTTIVAVAAAALPDDKRRTLTDLADVATQALIRIVHWVLLVAPLGILAQHPVHDARSEEHTSELQSRGHRV